MTRHQTILKISCDAPEELFAENYDDVPKALQEQVKQMGGLGCDGGGYPGLWCLTHKCKWHLLDEVEHGDIDD